MPIEGSFALYLEGVAKDFHVLVRETAKDGGGELEDSIKHFTPEKTGRLKKSIDRNKRPKRIAPLAYEVTVKTDLYYAKWVEYGTKPHIITPNDKAALEFTGVVTMEVEHPGATPSHMFQRGAAQFRDMKLEALMHKNLALYLAGGAKALRVT